MKRLLALLLTTAILATETQAQPTRLSWMEPITDMEFVSIESGCYEMGNPNALDKNTKIPYLQIGVSEPPFADEAPVHQICLDNFQIGRYEVTVDQWQKVMSLPAAVSTRSNQPVATVSWDQVQTFIDQLNRRTGKGQVFRLPTEAEWEYACRAGAEPLRNTPQHRQIGPFAWYSNTVVKRSASPQPVGQLQANPWQLHDMLGNTWEWVQDNYDPEGYLQHAYKNPVVDNNQTKRVIRGGSYVSPSRDTRCTSRGSYAAHESLPQIGLRLVRVKR